MNISELLKKWTRNSVDTEWEFMRDVIVDTPGVLHVRSRTFKKVHKGVIYEWIFPTYENVGYYFVNKRLIAKLKISYK